MRTAYLGDLDAAKHAQPNRFATREHPENRPVVRVRYGFLIATADSKETSRFFICDRPHRVVAQLRSEINIGRDVALEMAFTKTVAMVN